MDKASEDLRRASLWKTEELKRYFCVPQNKEQQPTQKNAFSKSALYDEMKSTPGSAFRGEQDFAGRQRS